MVGYNILPQGQEKPVRKRHEFLTNFHGQIINIDHDYVKKIIISGEKSCSFLNHALSEDEEDGDGDNNIDDDEGVADEPQPTIFWESQNFLLQEILERYNSSGATLRKEINRHFDMLKASNFCDCPNPKLTGCCVKCLRRRLVNRLCNKGFNAKLCTSQWKKTPKIPGGMHEFIEVIANTEGRKKQIPLLIEIGFQDEFRMGKACDEYSALINELPEIFIGKPEHLNAIIHVVCDAAKKSSTEKRVHMGPWRKRSFMQMKWSVSNEINTVKSLKTDQ